MQIIEIYEGKNRFVKWIHKHSKEKNGKIEGKKVKVRAE